MKITQSFFLCVLAVGLFFSQGCDWFLKSDVEITDIKAWGHYFYSTYESELMFEVTLTSQNKNDATVTDFLIQVIEGDTLVLEFTKNVFSMFHSAITPDPATVYFIPGNSTFSFNCYYEHEYHGDDFNGHNPDKISVTIYVEDENGYIYTVEETAPLTFLRE